MQVSRFRQLEPPLPLRSPLLGPLLEKVFHDATARVPPPPPLRQSEYYSRALSWLLDNHVY